MIVNRPIVVVSTDCRCFYRLSLFRCCCYNQRLLIKLVSSIAHADAPATDRFTVVIAAAGVVRDVAINLEFGT